MMTMSSKKKKYEVTDFGGMEKKRHSLDMESSGENQEMVGDVATTDRFTAEEANNDSDNDSDNATNHYPIARTIFVAEADVYDRT